MYNRRIGGATTCLYGQNNKLKEMFDVADLLLLGSAVAQSIERATPGKEVPGSIPAVAARSLLVGSVSV